MVQLLVEAWPNAVCLQNWNGYLALHDACLYDFTGEVIQFLIKCRPESVCCQAKHGTLPLHNACRNERPVFLAIRSLIEVWPDSVLEPDGNLADYHCTMLAGIIVRMM